MGFNFNPTLWYVCRFCRRSFTDTEKLKEHKLACHLGECLGVKCIVFEERLFETEWDEPEHDFCENRNRTLIGNNENVTSLKEFTNKIQLDYPSARESPFKNPYVSLTILTEEEIKSSLNGSSSTHKCEGENSRSRKRLLDRSSHSFESNPKLRGASPNNDSIESKITDNDICGRQSFNSNNIIHSDQEVQFKREFLIDSSTPDNSAGIESAYTIFKDARDNEFIVASVSANCDGIPQVQFTSTEISAPAQEYQLFQPQYLTLSDSKYDLYPDSTFENSENQEILTNIDADNLNSNLANVQIKIDIFDDQLLETSSVEVEGTGELEPQVSEFNLVSLPSSSLPITATTKAVEKNPFMCETCHDLFPTRYQLRQHEVWHSSSLKPFKCSECPSRFNRNCDLSRHMIVHGKESNFKCRFCSRSFSHNENLMIHERSHTGERPFKCSLAHCGYAASSKNVLATHTREKHSKELGLPQFNCSTCQKIFFTRKRFDIHIRIHHNGIIPFNGTN